MKSSATVVTSGSMKVSQAVSGDLPTTAHAKRPRKIDGVEGATDAKSRPNMVKTRKLVVRMAPERQCVSAQRDVVEQREHRVEYFVPGTQHDVVGRLQHTVTVGVGEAVRRLPDARRWSSQVARRARA